MKSEEKIKSVRKIDEECYETERCVKNKKRWGRNKKCDGKLRQENENYEKGWKEGQIMGKDEEGAKRWDMAEQSEKGIKKIIKKGSK